ncbi:LLM class flavin-dependent oxidoreductase [Mycolicibacterium sp. HK-90]|uniref:LLM class flavin-dependent oxidoreductase n=1 Tax=Mycolicibacterium sp. HK-90 TaxID=3056937 RepID=UPI00265992ED|nr:LLM class flavin-dependent oxidoreductase [Mycolicibacterium sp. HK-90]WKG03785.1 LLM class flavin-dependent oxidoreductase [Mycolicibacterium sp. HK-90]
MEISIALPTFTEPGVDIPDIPSVARHAEALGFDAAWAGDHLSTGAPFLESVVALSAAAAVTGRLQLGFGVLLLGLRSQAWAAKRIGSLQALSGGRVLLGVGVGGAPAAEWAAAGASRRGRGHRTDLMLQALPDLLSGKGTALRTELGEPTITLEPAVPTPPVWIGGASDAALHRTVRHGTGWLASLLSPDQIAQRRVRLAEMADNSGTAVPRIGTTLFTALGGADREQAVRWLESLIVPRETAEQMTISSEGELEDKLDHYVDAGVSHVVFNAGTQNPLAQYDVIAGIAAAQRAR